MNCIVIDIGNSSIKVGLSRSGRIMRVSRLPGGTRDRDTIDEALMATLGRTRIEGAVISSVVPANTGIWRTRIKKLVGYHPLLVGHGVKLGLKISHPNSVTIGGDRLANASGAFARYGAPVIIADFGSALTFDVISRKCEYIGGVIAPGLPLMTDYLAEKTALLPRVRLAGPCATVGASTAGAIRIGARIGYRGIVREVVQHLRNDHRIRGASLCATGGYAKLVLSGLDMPFHHDPHITLFGLSRIFELNASSAESP
jgi:type III pantothenate kinase